MGESTSRNIKLGLFVLLGTVVLILALYLIGSKQNLFGSTFKLQASFHNVNGLIPGNNVRFTGIDVGTVSSVYILNDSTVNVEMVLQNKVQKFIKKNALAMVGTDGLMGDKLINIIPVNEPAEFVSDGDRINTRNPVGTDEMMRTLDVTNENVKEISDQIKHIVTKLNSPNSLWNILMDTTLSGNVRSALVNIRVTGERTALLSGDLQQIVQDIRKGKGSIGALITDTTISSGLKQSIVNIKLISDSVVAITGDLQVVMASIREGKGAVGTLLMDTSFARNLNLTMENVQRGTKGFDDNMEALKHSIFLRKYFRNQKK